MTIFEGQPPPKTGWENADDALRDELRAERDAALAENERLREAIAYELKLSRIADEAYGNKEPSARTHRLSESIKSPIPAARQLLADTTDAVAAMQNKVHAKTL